MIIIVVFFRLLFKFRDMCCFPVLFVCAFVAERKFMIPSPGMLLVGQIHSSAFFFFQLFQPHLVIFLISFYYVFTTALNFVWSAGNVR